MSATELTRTGTYPIADEYRTCVNPGMGVRAMWTGEKRKPRKGEWYLTGAIITAYLSPADLDYPAYIAKLVRTKQETIITVLGDYIP
jgi:hypothetical protein